MATSILHNFRGEPPPLMAVGPYTISKDLLEVFAHQGGLTAANFGRHHARYVFSDILTDPCPFLRHWRDYIPDSQLEAVAMIYHRICGRGNGTPLKEVSGFHHSPAAYCLARQEKGTTHEL